MHHLAVAQPQLDHAERLGVFTAALRCLSIKRSEQLLPLSIREPAGTVVLAKVRNLWDRQRQLCWTGAAQMNETEKPSQGTKTALGIAGSVTLRAKLRVLPNILNSDICPTCFVIAKLPRKITPCIRDISFNGQRHEAPVVLQK